MRFPGGLPGGLPGSSPTAGGAPPAGKKKPGLTLSQMNGGPEPDANAEPKKQETHFDKFSQFVDTKTGSLKFAGKATLNSDGVQFASGTSFNISLDEVDTLDELGKGNYGTVYKVRHSRPRMRKPGQGLAGNKAAPGSPSRKEFGEEASPTSAKPAVGTGIVMAMKEVRLELDDSKFAAIIMELDVLHRCVSPFIVDTSLRFLFNWSAVNILPEQKLAAYPHLYSYTSTKSVVHWFQIIRNGTFQMYDDEAPNPITSNRSKYYKVAKFPTKNIKTPIVLVYGGSDSLVDIKVMLKELPAHTIAKEIPHYEHLDFLWAESVHTLGSHTRLPARF
jgi:hypothetical protein